MRLILGAAVLAAAALVPAAPAGAVAAGLLCDYAPIGVLDGEWQEWSAELHAGPLVLDDLGAGPATVTCTLQRWDHERHSDPDVAGATSLPTSGAVVLPPTVVPLPDGPAYYVLCTRVDVAGAGTYYFDVGPDGPAEGGWTTDPGARCRPIQEVGGAPPLDPLEPLAGLAEALLCPPLGLAGVEC